MVWLLLTSQSSENQQNLNNMTTHSIDIGGGRGKENFNDAMSNIARQAEAQKLLEERAQRRQALYGNIKKAFGFLLGVALLATAFCYRNELQSYVSAKLQTKAQVDSNTGATLSRLQTDAQKRDQVLDDITK